MTTKLKKKPKKRLITTRLNKSNKIQQYADIYLLLNCSTRFGRPSCPSSGVHKTVVAAYVTDNTIWGRSFFKRDVRLKGFVCVCVRACFRGGDERNPKAEELLALFLQMQKF